MLFYRIILLTIFIFNSSSVFSQWTKIGDTSVYIVDNSYIAKYIEVPHYSQPTNYTCGATNLTMLASWLTEVKGNKRIDYNIMSVYNFVNTNGTDGIQTDELKTGFDKLIQYTNNAYNMNLNLSFTEILGESIDEGINGIILLALSGNSPAPAILYGNRIGGLPGYHYFSVVGYVNCPSSYCEGNIKGLFLHDPMYGSPAFSGSKSDNAIEPFQFVDEDLLTQVWGKTGSSLPWEKKHILLSFPQ